MDSFSPEPGSATIYNTASQRTEAGFKLADELKGLKTEVLDRHQQYWTLALLPCVALMIVVGGAIFLYTTIDYRSAGRLSLEALLTARSSDMKPPAASLQIPLARPNNSQTPANAKPAGQINTVTASASNPTPSSSSITTLLVGSSASTPPGASASASTTPSNSPAPSASESSAPPEPIAAYPLFQAENIQDAPDLTRWLVPQRDYPHGPRTTQLATYLWERFTPQTQWQLQHTYDHLPTAPSAAPPLAPRWSQQRIGNFLHGFIPNITEPQNPQELNDAISTARLKTVLAEALNAQLTDEMLAVRFQPTQWRKAARAVIETQGEPQFAPEHIKNARRLAHKIAQTQAANLDANLKSRLTGPPGPPASVQQQAADRRALAKTLNELLFGPPLAQRKAFAAANLPPILTKLPVGENNPKGATSDDVLLANRLLIEQTFSAYLDKAAPRPTPDTLARLNRRLLTQMYSRQITDDPRPVPAHANVAERQAGRLAWLTFVGLNLAVCLGVIAAALAITAAAGQIQWEQANVPRLNDVKLVELYKFLEAGGEGTGKYASDAAKLGMLLQNMKPQMKMKDLFPDPVEDVSLTDDLLRGLHSLFTKGETRKKLQALRKKRALLKRLNLLLTKHDLTLDKPRDVFWWNEMRLTPWLRSVRPSLQQQQRIRQNWLTLSSFAASWAVIPQQQADEAKEDIGKLEVAESKEQERPLAWRQQALLWLLFLFTLFSIYQILSFPPDQGTIGALLKLTAEQELVNIGSQLKFYEFFGLLAALLLTVATSVLLISPTHEYKVELMYLAHKSKSPDKQQVLDDEVALYYARKNQHLRNILYISTAVLATSVLQVSYTFNWALTYLPPDEALAKQMQLLVKTIVTERAVYYTLLLSAIYFPASAVLRARVAELADDAWRHQNEWNERDTQAAQNQQPAPQPAASDVKTSEAVKTADARPLDNSQNSRQANRIARRITQALAGVLKLPLSDKSNAESKPTDKPANAPPAANTPASANTLQTRQQWLKDRGLASDLPEMLPRLVAVALPLLAGPAAEILKSLIGNFSK